MGRGMMCSCDGRGNGYMVRGGGRGGVIAWREGAGGEWWGRKVMNR